MKKRTYVGAATRPVSLTPVIRVENPYNEQHTDQYGTLTQSYDTLTGDYYPDRNTYPTLLGLHVLMKDPNGSTPDTEVVWSGQNTVAWEVVRNGVTIQITAQSTGIFTLYGSQLRVKLNQRESDGNVLVRATGTFCDSTGRVQTAVAEEPLLLSSSTATNLTLLRDKLGTAGYVGEFFRLNPLTLHTVERVDNADNWKKKCAVQLCDGTVPLPDAFPLTDGESPLDDDSYDNLESGSAFYFWYYRTPDNRLIQCTEDTEWFDAAWLESGTASKEVAVDLTKVKHVRLVCRAGHIPYGQMDDYLDEDGLLRPEKLLLGFREQTFDVGVELPDVERIVVADIAHCQLERTELASSSVTIKKRALVTAGGTTLNDLSETTPHSSSSQSWVEKLYAIEWFVTRANGTEVSIGTGEWLQITPAQLATLYGGVLNADAMPAMSVSVEPRYPKLTGNNYVEGYMRGASAITPSQQQGNKAFLKQLDFWLIDTTDNAGVTTRGMKLQRNNILRFAGGGWAPVVRISQEMEADAELELWRKNANGAFVKYCDAGRYDPVRFVEAVLRPYFRGTLQGWYEEDDGGWPRLYKVEDSNYVEAHAVMPWETTETKYTIGVGFPFGVYLLDHVVGDSGWEWNGIFTDVTEWDGIDFSQYYLPPTAFSPGPATQIVENGKTVFRKFFYLSHPQGGIGGVSAAGILGSTMFNEAGRAYPKTDDVSVLTNASRARANNSVASRSYPFAEGGFLTLDTLITSQELLYSRRNPFLDTLFGSGISSNDPCTNEETFHDNGGIRHKVSGAAGYTYGTWSSSLPVKSATNSSNNASADMNDYHGKEQCMESQLAASFAVEFSIVKTTDGLSPEYFVMYGGKYYWEKPTGIDSLEEGFMNVRVYRELSDTLTGYKTDGTQTTCEFEAVLRMSLMGGLNLSGDIYAYVQGGAEAIGTCDTDPAVSKTGNPVSCYLIPDQTKWLLDTAVTINNPEGLTTDELPENLMFLIEKSQDAIMLTTVGEEPKNLADGYSARRLGYSPMKLAAGGGLASHECHYVYSRNEWGSLNKRVRLALRFRGHAFTSHCSPRYWYANNAASNTNRPNGGSAQALIGT